ncbi:MAG: protein kinase [Holophaga sp.]
MSITVGACLGPYEVLGRLGAGGMGVVYRARDTRLGREVAIKVLPAAFAEDGDRLRRFELEARATGSLNHPNLMVVFDSGTHEGEPYLVMELLNGETLRERLSGKPLPTKKAVEIALQVAQGLTAAHEKGIVHRDLKPDNIFITREGRVKILDFGLAKITEGAALSDGEVTERLPAPLEGSPSIAGPGTAMGMVVGTVGYMSPEQVRGEKLDGRSDLFCLGVILWEMLTGKHPFRGDSSIETLHAIMKEEPPEVDPSLKWPPLLERVLHSCLAKEPSGRFHSAHDLAFALEATTGSDTGSLAGLKVNLSRPRRMGRALPWVAGGGSAVLLYFGLAWYLAWPPFRPATQPRFTRLTYAQGTVNAAFFSADGRSIFYSGRFHGQKPEIFVRTPESPEARPLQSLGADLLAVSNDNELAVLKEAQETPQGRSRTLAQMPGGGGNSRDLLENVLEAAWRNSGQKLAVVTQDSGFRSRLECPPGKVLHTSLGSLKLLRMSPAGDRLALVDGTGGRTDVMVFEASGAGRILFTKAEDAFASSLTGLAWKPDGTELWYSEQQGSQTAIWALTMTGRRRLVWRAYGTIQLLDLAANGRVLAASHQVRTGVFFQLLGQASVRDLSIQDGTQAIAFTPDGSALLLQESASLDGNTGQDLTYLLNLEGGSPVRLAQGSPRSLSPDGKYVGMSIQEGESETPGNVLTFVPTGAGSLLKVGVPDRFEGLDDGLLFQKGTKVLFAGLEKGQDWRFYTMDRTGGVPRPFTPVGIRAPRPLLLSPDGTTMVGTTTTRGQHTRYALNGEGTQPIRGLKDWETPFAWTADGRNLLVSGRADELPIQIYLLDPDTGKRRLVHTFAPPDATGYLQTPQICMSADGKRFAFTFRKKLSELFLIEGLK